MGVPSALDGLNRSATPRKPLTLHARSRRSLFGTKTEFRMPIAYSPVAAPSARLRLKRKTHAARFASQGATRHDEKRALLQLRAVSRAARAGDSRGSCAALDSVSGRGASSCGQKIRKQLQLGGILWTAQGH